MHKALHFFKKAQDCDFDYQENLLSYNDDLLKVVRCCVNNFIVNTAFQNSQITVYGKTKITLTYISESSGLHFLRRIRGGL